MGVSALREEIEKKLAGGMSRPELFRQLVQRDSLKADKFAFAIATYPAKPIAENVLIANTLLLFMLLCLPVLTLLDAMPVDLKGPTIFLVLQLVVPLICLYFAFHYHGMIYRICGVWFMVDLIEGLFRFSQDSLVESLRLLCLFFIVVLAAYVARKLFPHLRLVGLRKDAEGNYLL